MHGDSGAAAVPGSGDPCDPGRSLSSWLGRVEMGWTLAVRGKMRKLTKDTGSLM